MAFSRSKKASKRSLSPNPILGSSSKRRRPITVSKILPFTKRWDFLIFYVFQPIISEDLDSPSSSPSSYTASDTASVYNTATNGQLLFKDPNFEVGVVVRLQGDIESKSKRLFGVAQWQEHSPGFDSQPGKYVSRVCVPFPTSGAFSGYSGHPPPPNKNR